MSIAHNDNLNLRGAITVDAWINPSGPGINNGIILMKNPLKYGLIWRPSDQKVTFSLDIGGWGDHWSNAVVPTNQWSHVAGTYDGSKVRIYINGLPDADYGRTGSIASSADELTLGFRTYDEAYNGLIDEVEIFNRALSAKEIAAIYNAGSMGKCRLPDDISGLRLWLRADSGVITGGSDNVLTWEDRSGNGLNVAQTTEANRPTRVAADLNGMPVVRFDGVNDYLIRSAVPGYDLFDNFADTVFIVQKQDGTKAETTTFSWAPDGFNRFMVHATWQDFIYYQVGSNAGEGDQWGAPQPYGWDDRWHLLKFRRDGVGAGGLVEVDGIGLSPTINSFSPGNNLPTASFYVGGDGLGGNNWFKGEIAEILIFNRALNTQEQQTVDNYLRGKYGLNNTPDGFTIPDKVNQPLNSVIESAAITVSGITMLSPISISAGGEYAVNGGAYTSTAGIVVNGDSIMVRQTSSASFSMTTGVTLTIGGVAGTFSVTTRAQAADLSIVKTSTPATPVLGQPLTYTLTVTNAGPDTAEQVTVTDVLPASLTYNSASAPCSYESGLRTVTCNLGSLSNGAQQSVDIGVFSNVSGPVSNTATVASSISDPAGGNNSSTRDVTVEVHLFLPLIIRNL